MMTRRRLVHVSDLHVGRNDETNGRVAALAARLAASEAEHVVVTGDVTHRGKRDELAEFRRLFAPVEARLTVIPGNHDRLGDEIAVELMLGARVLVERAPGLHLVCVDSTGAHNRNWVAAHGALWADDVAAVLQALDSAAPGDLRVVLLHHHLLPLPSDDPLEALFTWLGYPYADELPVGRDLIASLRGRCDIVLHGHRHRPGGATLFPQDARALHIYNAGSSPIIGSARVFAHAGGALVGGPVWLPGNVTASSSSCDQVASTATQPRFSMAQTENVR